MRRVITAILLPVFAIGAFAQHRDGVRRPAPLRTQGFSSGYGNVVFPGTGGPPMVDPFAFSFGQRLLSLVNGGYRGFPAQGRRQGGVVAVPYPVMVGGFDNPYAYQQTPNVTVVMPPQYAAQPAAPVTINQYFGPETPRPAMQEYAPEANPSSDSGGLRMYQAPTGAAPEPSQSDQVTFFIAMKDSSVYTALAYWVDGETLHYITPQGKHNQASLALVDRDLSAKLNEGHQVEFRLPAR